MINVRNAIVTGAMLDPATMRYSGAVYHDGGLVEQSLRPAAAWKFGGTSPQKTPSEELERGVYIGRFFGHFGHFLIETLPNLGWLTDNDQMGIAHPWPPTLDWKLFAVPHVRFSINALNIDPRRIALVKEDCLVRELLVPPCNEIILGRVSERAFEVYTTLRNCALRLHTSTAGKVYFSRRLLIGESRPTVNEAETEDILKSLGFVVVYPETLPFVEQVSIAAGAKVIAGIDGSALHLCAFMHGGGTCIVLSSRVRMRAIEALNSAVGVKTEWVDGLCSIRKVDGISKVVIDNSRLVSVISALNGAVG